MFIECVIVSVGYADFLAHTLPLNKSQFDRVVIVTSPTDLETQKLCEYHHVECIQTEAFYEDGADFNKGKGINAGLAQLAKTGWVLHLDADIILPTQFRQTLEPLDLDPHCVYGVDRLMCKSYADWAANVVRPHLTQEAGIYIHPYAEKMAIGTRIAKYGTDQGFIPIGFFQLWNPLVSGVQRYPEQHQDAGRSDMLFTMQWPRRQRGFIPEIITIHLESEEAPGMGKNWRGRKTRAFGPDSSFGEEVDLEDDEYLGYEWDDTVEQDFEDWAAHERDHLEKGFIGRTLMNLSARDVLWVAGAMWGLLIMAVYLHLI